MASKPVNEEVLGTLGAGSVYLTRAMHDQIMVNGAIKGVSPASTGFHDLLMHSNIVNPLTGRPNFGTINIGRPLVQIPGATTAPYWTDPGSQTLTTSSCTLAQEAISGQLDFVKDGTYKCARFTSKVGYGDAAGGKRRVQLNSYEISSRIRVAWDLSFKLTNLDDLPYNDNNGSPYKYPMLIWQLKGGVYPSWGLNVESVGDGASYDIFMTFRWSGVSDGINMRRYFANATTPAGGLSGNIHGFSNNTRYFQKRVKKGEWVDMVIEMFIDERDATAAAGGYGFCNVWINGNQELIYVGPTLMYKDIDSQPCPAHAWSIGLYRHESAVPSNLREYDLTSKTNPAPFQRQISFRRARLLRLSDR